MCLAAACGLLRSAVKFKDKAREKQRRAALKQKEAQRAQQVEAKRKAQAQV